MKHDYREFYEKDYLGSWNIPESGELTLTIVKCFQGELNNPGTKKKTKKPVLHFQETEKGMALNVTNGKTIASLYGNYVEQWPGKQITLFKSMTRNPGGGDDVECLRIRPTVPKHQPSSSAAATAAPPVSSSLPGAEDVVVAGTPTDELLIAEVGTWVKRAKFDMAYDLARGIKDAAKRTDAEARIGKAMAYVQAKAGA